MSVGDLYGCDCPACNRVIYDLWDLIGEEFQPGVLFQCPHCRVWLAVCNTEPVQLEVHCAQNPAPSLPRM